MPNHGLNFRSSYTYSELVEAQSAPADTVRLAQLQYHLNSNDYFAFLATVFGFLEESLDSKKTEPAGEELAMVRNIRKDLIYLQNEYHINHRAIEA